MADISIPLIGANPPAVSGVPAGAAAAPFKGRDFARVLDAKLEGGLRFSAHAQARLRSREIPLTDADCGRLAEATSQAARKGAREALLLMGDLGFIVSVPSRTVITALDSSRMDGGVVTGIDAAVVVPEA